MFCGYDRSNKTNKMVRKRSRTSRKYYESDDNDSDSDFALDDPPAAPAQKKYSLRQRKRPLFTEDFDYDDDGDEIEPPKAASDDDDFEVENELELDEAPESEYIDKTTYINHYEPEASDIPEDAEGLIDFEDMIRADIVVNKNRIDYDNIIQKTEIKVQPIEETPIQPVKSKRGRKPKARPAEEIDSSILEPETEVQEEIEHEDKNDKDYNPIEDLENDELIDCAKIMQAELKECIMDNASLCTNETAVNGTEVAENEENKTSEIQIEEQRNTCVDITEGSPVTLQESSITVNENLSLLQEHSQTEDEILHKEKIQTNGDIFSKDLKEPDEKLLQIKKCEVRKPTENDDDDVVLVEDGKKCEVIVLDD